MSKVSSYDATVKARKSSTGRPQMINGWYASNPSSPTQVSMPTAPGRMLSKSSKLGWPEWLKATGKSLKGLSTEARQEVCRAYICYSRGNVYMSPSERNAECFQAVAVVVR